MHTIIAKRTDSNISVFLNGDHFQLTFNTIEEAREQFQFIVTVKNNPTDENVASLKEFLSPTYKEEVLEIISKDRNGNYYIKDVNIPLPYKLMVRMKEQLEDGLPITNLVNFFKLLCLNPDKHVRESLFKFMDTFNMPITDKGYFIGYKSVAWVGEQSRKFAETVCSAYLYKKAANKSPKDSLIYQKADSEGNAITDYYFWVNSSEFEDLDAHLIEISTSYTELEVNQWDIVNLSAEEQDTVYSMPDENDLECFYYTKKVVNMPILLGNAEDLFPEINELFNKDSYEFTDWHTKKTSIKLGTPSTMPRAECDNNEQVSCSSGLHVGAPHYVSRFGHGDSNYILACLVNPMHVVAVPMDYSWQKLRCCEYLPYAICEFKDGSITEIDTKYFEEDYASFEETALQEMLAELEDNKEISNESKEDLTSIIRNRLVVVE